MYLSLYHKVSTATFCLLQRMETSVSVLAHTLAQLLLTHVNHSSYLRGTPSECAWQMDSGQEVHQDVKVGEANLQLCLLMRKNVHCRTITW